MQKPTCRAERRSSTLLAISPRGFRAASMMSLASLPSSLASRAFRQMNGCEFLHLLPAHSANETWNAASPLLQPSLVP